MRLQLATWPQVEAYLARSKSIILPTGSTEQHGPNGLIGTDSLCAEAVAWRVGELLDVMVGPTVNVGMAQHHMAFPGSMTLKPSTLLAVLRDSFTSLVRHGFERILVINGHGGNCATIQAAFSETQLELDSVTPRPTLRTLMMNWWETPEVDKVSTEMFGNAVGAHATPPEVAVTFALFPETTDQRKLDPEVGPRGFFYGSGDFRATFPDGRIASNPSLASPEKGEVLLRVAAEDIAKMSRNFLLGD